MIVRGVTKVIMLTVALIAGMSISVWARLQNPNAKEDFFISLLLQIELNDIDNDGTADIWRTFHTNGSIRELKFDLDSDGRPDTVDHYSPDGVHIFSEYLTPFAFWQSSHDSWQRALNGKTIPEYHLQFDRAAFKKSSLGFYVQDACYKRIGNERLKTILFESLADAAYFLWQHRPVGRDHLRRLIALIHGAAHPLRIICNLENGPAWESMIGYATPISDPDYPAIFISPKISKRLGELRTKNLIFHELFHLIGYLHYSDREYAYACGQDLFPSDVKLEPSLTGMADQVCLQNDLPLNDAYYRQLAELLNKLKFKSVAANYLLITLSLNSFSEAAFMQLIKLYTTSLFNPAFATTLISEASAKKLLSPPNRKLMVSLETLARKYAYPESFLKATTMLSKAKVSLFKGGVMEAYEILSKITIPSNQGFPANDYRALAYSQFKDECAFLTLIITQLFQMKRPAAVLMAKNQHGGALEQFSAEQDPNTRATLLVNILPKLPPEKLSEYLLESANRTTDSEGKATMIYYLGLLAMKNGNYSEALSKFEASEKAPSVAQDARAAIAWIAFNNQEYLKAKEILKNLIQRYPEFGFSHYLMGRIYGEEKRMLLKEKAFEIACAKGFKPACAKN